MSTSGYESERLLAEYLLFHYGSSKELLGVFPGPVEAVGFPVRVVRELLVASQLPSSARALDIGCAVGASTFELARHCTDVVGMDFSQKFIEAASILATQGELATHTVVEGECMAPFIARVPLGLPRNPVVFRVGDAMNLPRDLGAFDVVLAANLLCRLPSPKQFLEALPSLVQPGGQLLLSTPFSWLEEFTPKSAWLGGREPEGGLGRSWETLGKILTPDFELQERKDLPFLIREHARKFQYGISLGSRWIRRH